MRRANWCGGSGVSGVSIHASVKDATKYGEDVGIFNRVSIHASVKDATGCLHQGSCQPFVSIHASVKDATISRMKYVLHGKSFNPRICKRCDHFNPVSSSASTSFNPRICKRCDHRGDGATATAASFNPRICKRCDVSFILT